MSRIPSQMIALGTTAPDFVLPDTISQKEVSLRDFRGEHATVIMFLCNHCPYVQHVNAGIVVLSKEYTQRGVGFAAISANDVADYPQDAPDMMKEVAQEQGYTFPYLYDESQDVAKSYGTSCTPDLFIFDKNLKLAYHGQFDDTRLGDGKDITGESFRNALDQLIAGKPVTVTQIPSIGCSIKWK